MMHFQLQVLNARVHPLAALLQLNNDEMTRFSNLLLNPKGEGQ